MSDRGRRTGELLASTFAFSILCCFPAFLIAIAWAWVNHLAYGAPKGLRSFPTKGYWEVCGGAVGVLSLMYAAMTVDSARRYYAGRGGQWKGRTIPAGR